MIRIIVNKENVVLTTGEICEYGYWDDEPDIKKWKISDYSYVINPEYSTAYTVDELPADYVPNKYLFINGEFVKNPDWVEPPKSNEERIAELENDIKNVWDEIAQAIEEGVNEV